MTQLILRGGVVVVVAGVGRLQTPAVAVVRAITTHRLLLQQH